MWCRVCHQDVPAVAAIGDPSQVRCARCGEVMTRQDQPSVEASESSTATETNRRAPLGSNWQLDDELREAKRLVQKVKANGTQRLHADDQSTDTNEEQCSVPPAKAARAEGGSTLSWSLSGLGLAGLVCGCALLVWSLVAHREELWTIGLPIALVSQVVLICGVLLRRDGAETSATDEVKAPSATYVQVQSSNGTMQPSGLSVHFSNSTDVGGSMNTDRLRREIETVMQRNRAA